MTISFVAATTAIQNSGTSIGIFKPAGVVAGNLMVALLHTGAASAPIITPPTGWVSRGTGTLIVSGGELRVEAFTKVAGGSEPAGYGFISSQSLLTASCAICAYSATGTIVQGSDFFAFDNTAPVAAASVTTTRPNAKLFCGFMTLALGSGITGMTIRTGVDNGFQDIAAFDQDIASPGATGSRVYTGSDFGWSYSLAIEEEVAAEGNRIRMMI